MLIAILLFVLILSFLVLTHEFGHFAFAKLSGVKVEEFGLGLPPRFFGFYSEQGKRKFIFGSEDIKTESTIYSLNLIPFGGFNKIYGEEVVTGEELKDPKSFASKSLPTRALIVLGGILVGIVAAVAIFYFILGFNGFTTYQALIFRHNFIFGTQNDFPMVAEIQEGSPAEAAKLQPYDLVMKVNGIELKGAKDLTDFIKKSGGQEISLTVKNLRTKETREISVIPQVETKESAAKIGVGLQNVAQVSYQKPIDKIFAGFFHSANLVHYSSRAFYNLIRTSFTSRSITPIANQTTGIVGIFAITKLTLQQVGLAEIFNLVGLLSLALAITNFLPLPALDGGRLVFLGIEAVFKKRVSPAIERKINTAGLTILILLYILITYKDILQYKDIIFK